MKRIPTIFLQFVIVLIGIGTLVAILWEPLLEGANIHSTWVDVYFKDPFIAYAYATSLLFFIALYQAFILLGYIRNNTVFSLRSLAALRIIQYCSLATACLIVARVIYASVTIRSQDDSAGGVMLGLVITSVFLSFAAVAAVCMDTVRNVIEKTSENI